MKACRQFPHRVTAFQSCRNLGESLSADVLSGHSQIDEGCSLVLVNWCSIVAPWTTSPMHSLRELQASILLVGRMSLSLAHAQPYLRSQVSGGLSCFLDGHHMGDSQPQYAEMASGILR